MMRERSTFHRLLECTLTICLAAGLAGAALVLTRDLRIGLIVISLSVAAAGALSYAFHYGAGMLIAAATVLALLALGVVALHLCGVSRAVLAGIATVLLALVAETTRRAVLVADSI